VNELGQVPVSPNRAQGEELPPPRPPVAVDALLARRLVRAAREASLATVSDGQPFASLVTPACAPDLSVLLWLSKLSGHTRHLMRDPRCSLLFVGRSAGANPQKRARVTVTGLAELIEGEATADLKRLWLARHPYARLYAEFADFGLWRIAPKAALFVGGFARARPLAEEFLRPDPAAVATIAAVEPGVIQHMNSDHADAVDAIACGLLKRKSAGWTFSGLDVDGCWLTRGAGARVTAARYDFATPVASAGEVRDALVQAAREGRARLEGAGQVPS
jgi:putative heme iron utilization protein